MPKIFTSLLSDYFRWLGGGVVVLIVILGYLFVIKPQLATIQSTNLTQRSDVRGKVESSQQYLDSLTGSIKKFHNVLSDETIGSIDDFLPSSPDFPGLLITIRNLATSSNVELKSMSLSQSGTLAANQVPGAGTTGETTANAAAATSLNLKTQDINIVVSGGTSYDDFKRFLGAIEASRRLFDVTTLSFTVGGNETHNYALTIRTYYLPSS